MFELLKLRKRHGFPVINDIRGATVMDGYRGFPVLNETLCPDGCVSCGAVCPTGALTGKPLRLDMGKCIFCGECARTCPAQAIRFSPAHRLAATCREALILSSREQDDAYHAKFQQASQEIRGLFGRSLKLRQVSAGGCNGCEMELAACGNVNFDMGRFGIDFVASPRHADGVVLTGPVSRNMAPALRDAYQSIGSPKLFIAVGACAISGGIFAGSPQLERSFLTEVPADLLIPGCPPHPLTFIHGMLNLLQRL